jgi:hypothetical protein
MSLQILVRLPRVPARLGECQAVVLAHVRQQQIDAADDARQMLAQQGGQVLSVADAERNLILPALPELPCRQSQEAHRDRKAEGHEQHNLALAARDDRVGVHPPLHHNRISVSAEPNQSLASKKNRSIAGDGTFRRYLLARHESIYCIPPIRRVAKLKNLKSF